MNAPSFAPSRNAFVIARARLAFEQRARLDARARRLVPQRRDGLVVCAVVGGRGRNRRLAELVAPHIANVTIQMGAPIETAERVAASASVPRVIVFAPLWESEDFVREARRRGWRTTDMLAGLRTADREAFMRILLRSYAS